MSVVREVIDHVPVMMWATDRDGNRQFVNRAWLDFTGVSDAAALAERWKECIHPHDLERCLEAFRHAQTSETPVDLRYRLRDKSGEYRWVHDHGTPHSLPDGSFAGFIGVCSDVSERMEWERSLRERDHLLHAVSQATRLLLSSAVTTTQIRTCLQLVGEAANVDRVYLFQNHTHPETGATTMRQLVEWCRDGVQAEIDNPKLQNLAYDEGMSRQLKLHRSGRAYKGFVRELPEEERAILEPQHVVTVFCAPVTVRGNLWGFVGFDDCQRERHWTASEEAILFALAGSLGAAMEREHTERMLHARDKLLQGVARATHQLLTNPDYEAAIRAALGSIGTAAHVERAYIFENKSIPQAAERIMAERFVWRSGDDAATTLESPPILSYDVLFPGWYDILSRGQAISGCVQDFLKPADGTARSLRSILLVPIMLDDAFWGFLGFDDSDIHRDWRSGDESILKAVAGSLGGAIARHRANEALRQSEELLRHSQKMDAVGRLAGGVAHDFNNLLTAILGYGELVLTRLPPETPHIREIREICRAAERAHALTRQLLVFSRKQVLDPRIVSVNNIVTDMDRLLRRLIGEHVELSSEMRHDLWPVRIDPGQLEQVVINLCVNARDAMPDGGCLDISTDNVVLQERLVRDHWTVEPGRYVTLTIRDTGCGMDDHVKAHLFEPFFTTKERGKGTGLGLSIVYGIVRQSGGAILVKSRKDEGTTFVIYLPRAENVPAAESGEEPSQPVQGKETILLVEDENIVRELSERILSENGYHVLAARNGREAMAIFESDPAHVDMLLTDVVMPQVSGRVLAQRLTSERPELKVLYMSGYAEDTIHGLEGLSTSTNFLQKPFTPSSLARKVREILDAH